MKKLLFSLLVAMAFTFASQAQTTTQKTKVEKKGATTKVEKKTTVTTKDGKTVTSQGVVLKKDGTPDKRYKQKVHVKKDGTPDKRYKENKK
ncbi:hypothetical protein HUK80_15040 [Flavobacterium sp. MAH-1]|uniref:Uncharacterized protein n=1 Tax=Flavobacterium agri TaxID=2743471 RepID=A0A7Y9C8B7_9FLAO|nr:hypothetical protein [Flavobacterium agri]NUY82218.1 hypothetical protein [Flavobacterium agri]NYA72242.1 hypothetical protein [Flavobacterium agri]